MARDPREVIAALRAKTVANGCTPEEAATAKAKADELCDKYGIPKADRMHAKGRFTFTFDEGVYAGMWEELRRATQRAAEAEMRRRAKEEQERRTRQARKTDFKTVRECTEYYLNPKWTDRTTGKAPTNEKIARVVSAIMGSQTTAASVAWYRNRMKKEGRL